MFWRLAQFIRHLFYWRHRQGHGIHSPYLFSFVHQALFNHMGLELPEALVREHRNLKRDRSPIQHSSPGPGSKTRTFGRYNAGSFIRQASVNEKYGALLFRIVSWFRPEMILELGTGLGLSAAYLSSAASQTPLHSMEGSAERVAFAQHLLKGLGADQVHLHLGDMDELLPEILSALPQRFLVFLDGNHRYEPTLRYCRSILERAEEEAILILDDIYWSKDMYRAWTEIRTWPEVRASIDLFRMGILIFRQDLDKKRNLKVFF